MSYLERVRKMIEAYSHPTRAAMVHMLQIYPKLSTTEISEKVSCSKSTALRHLEVLTNLGLVNEERIKEGRGRYPTSYFSFNPKGALGLLGRDMTLGRPELTQSEYEGYLRSYQHRYALIRDIMNDALEYLDMMIEQVHQLPNEEGSLVKRGGNRVLEPEAMYELGKSHLGPVDVKYLPKSKVWKDYYNVETESEEDELSEYVEINLLLPIRQLVETVKSGKWQNDKELWPLDEEAGE